ncbi:hypothetical protein CBR_g44492 [Chara braunii]|uniref:Uncharacterized protein n=1 Tax=Chara braunii TaxID=69332 RepID=A0A388LXN7_CHABU|nr:hypothetical protein CBR_g44492 [Chara braunii]|eukprot:GBG87035.1 hypothetical protein CBR_g44492 [Chara braunii]
MEPVYDLLRRLDRGGLHMSRVVEWTQDVARQVAEDVCALPADLAHYIVQRVQARCAHMLESAHAADHLLFPSRQDLRYFEGVVSDYDVSLVREAETYILSQTGFSVASPEYETACAQLRDFHTQRGMIAWGGRDEDREAQRCTGDAETYEAPSSDVGDVFGTRAATLHPYPRDDSNSEGHEDEDERAVPATATRAADERDEWSDPEDVRRRSGGDDLFVRLDFEESRGRHGSPLERQRPTSTAPQSTERERDPGSVPSRGAESGIGGGAPGYRSGIASSTALPTSTEQLHRHLARDGRLHRLVRGPRQRLEDRLAGGPSPVQGDEGDTQGLAGGDGGALAGGGCGIEVAAAVEAHEIRSGGDEGIPTGGGGGFSEFGDTLLGRISFLDPNSFSPAMRGEVMSGAEGDEDRTPLGETSEESLDRLESRRACLMAQRDPRTQAYARVAVEERWRQLGTFTSASLDVAPGAHTDPPTEVHDTTQREATLTEASSMGVDVRQGTHESGLAAAEEPRSESVQPPAVQLRPEETSHEVEGVPLATGLVEGAVQMSPGLEDIQTGQSVGVDDMRPSAQAEGRAPTTGGEAREGGVAGTVDVGGVGVPVQADPMSTSGGGNPAQVDRRDADGQEMPQTLVVRTTVGPVVPHQAPFLEDHRRRAHRGGPVEDRRVGRGKCIPPVPTFAPSRARPEIRYVATPRGSLPFGFMTAKELEEHGRTNLTEIDQCILSETRRVTTASADRQPGLRGVSTSARRRDVVASGFDGRGGGGGGSGGDGDGRREGAGGATTSAVDLPRTYGLREVSIILQESDVVTRPRQARHVPLDRRQEGETSGTDDLPMARESRRRDDLAAAGTRTVRGRRVIMDDDPDERPVAPEPSTGKRGGQRQRDRGRGSGRSHGRGSHRSERDPRAHDDC